MEAGTSFAPQRSRPIHCCAVCISCMVEQLFSAMLSSRLGELSQAPNAPFLRAQTDRDLFVRTIEVTSLDALVAKGGVERGLSALFTEIARVQRFGFTQPELNRMAFA